MVALEEMVVHQVLVTLHQLAPHKETLEDLLLEELGLVAAEEAVPHKLVVLELAVVQVVKMVVMAETDHQAQ